MNPKRLLVLTILSVGIAIGSGFGNRDAGAAATTRIVDDNLACPGATYTSIQAAVNDSSPGDIVKVCAGTYNELVTVDKTLTIQGVQAGVDARTRAVPPISESIVGSGDGAFRIEADNVVIDGFTIQGVNVDQNSDPAALGSAIWMNPDGVNTHGGAQIRNNIIQNNVIGIELDNTGSLQARIERNLIQNNNETGADGGTGIDSNFVGVINAVIDSNKFAGNMNSAIDTFVGGSNITVSNNEFAANRRAIGWSSVTGSNITMNNIHNSTDSSTADVRIFGGVTGLTITCNDITNGAGRGIRMDNGFGTGLNSDVAINTNNIAGNAVAGLVVDSLTYLGVVHAEANWWGSPTGPTIASNPGGTGDKIVDPDGIVMYQPFLTSPASCAPDQCPNDPNKILAGACGCGVPDSPGCTTNRRDCEKFVEQQKKDFDKQQETDKKNFDKEEEAEKKAFDATHPTAAQRKAFEDEEKAERKTFENQQKTAKENFEQQNKANKEQCKSLPK
jgi:hypothetical protein